MPNENYQNQMVLAYAKGDVTGDKIPDHVYLTGKTTTDSPFIQNITLVIQDGRSGSLRSILLKENAGYNPRLQLLDFSGDGIPEIFIGYATGGSGGTMIYYIYSYKNTVPIKLLDSDNYNQTYAYNVTYMNNYKVDVFSKINSTRYLLDISLRDKEYLSQIYTPDGILKMPVQGFVNPISGLYPIDYDSNGVYELLAYQKIAGLYNADALGYVQNELKLNGNSFVLFNQLVAVVGYEV